MYRFLATPRWLGLAGLTLALAAAMVALGFWQLDRYHERSAFNARVDAAARAAPTPLPRLLRPGQPVPDSLDWTKASATGHFDTAHEVLARGRTLDGDVGFEVLTPLVLADGSAVLVDRGWVPAPVGAATTVPSVPAPPEGAATVVGRLHLPESRSDQPISRDGRIEVRRIAPNRLTAVLPYPLFDAYLLQDEPVDQRFRPIPSDHQNDLQNAGYVVQWWMFAACALVGFGFLARREATPDGGDSSAAVASDTAEPGARRLERLADRPVPVTPPE